MREVYKEFTNLFPIMLERNKQKKLKFNEEAQTLSFLYYKLGFENNEANKFIKRIWTSPKCYNFTEGDIDLHILHLPYEKKYGYNELFAKLNMLGFKYVDKDYFKKLLKSAMRLQENNILGNIKLILSWVRYKILKIFTR